MDLLNWIAASERMEFVSDSSETAVRAEILRYQARGFITDFIDAPIVAKATGTRILISRASSFWGRIGVRCVAYVTPVGNGSLICARVWHGPLFTAWLCFSYGLSTLLVVASSVAAFQSSNAGRSVATLVAGGLMGVFWIVVTGAFNAMLRAQRQKSITELMSIPSSVASRRPNQSSQPPPRRG